MCSRTESQFPFDVMSLLNREFDVRGVFRYANVYGACVDLIAAGRVNVGPLVTARYGLEGAEEALVFASTRKDACIKVAVTVP